MEGSVRWRTRVLCAVGGGGVLLGVVGAPSALGMGQTRDAVELLSCTRVRRVFHRCCCGGLSIGEWQRGSCRVGSSGRGERGELQGEDRAGIKGKNQCMLYKNTRESETCSKNATTDVPARCTSLDSCPSLHYAAPSVELLSGFARPRLLSADCAPRLCSSPPSTLDQLTLSCTIPNLEHGLNRQVSHHPPRVHRRRSHRLYVDSFDLLTQPLAGFVDVSCVVDSVSCRLPYSTKTA